MLTAFLSYARETQDQARSLAQDIEALGISVWFDQQLTGGKAWWDHILEQIRACETFVFMLAPSALESVACKREYTYAARLGKTILPVLVADGVAFDLLPAALAQVHFVDYRRQDREALRALARAVHTLPKSAPMPEPLPEPPAVPVSYLGELKEQIESGARLDFDQQTGLLMRLKQGAREAKDFENALALLRRLRARDDLYARVADEIDAFIRDNGRGLRAPAAVADSPGGFGEAARGSVASGAGAKQVEADAIRPESRQRLQPRSDPDADQVRPAADQARTASGSEPAAAPRSWIGAVLILVVGVIAGVMMPMTFGMMWGYLPTSWPWGSVIVATLFGGMPVAVLQWLVLRRIGYRVGAIRWFSTVLGAWALASFAALVAAGGSVGAILAGAVAGALAALVLLRRARGRQRATVDGR